MNQFNSLAKEAAELAEKAGTFSDKIKILAASGAGGTENIFVSTLTIFLLACFVGYYVVWKVTPSLHTPLMSVTNAISGIVAVGAMAAAGSPGFGFSNFLGCCALFLAALNIFGGFTVTARMLEMFKKKKN